VRSGIGVKEFERWSDNGGLISFMWESVAIVEAPKARGYHMS